jgi:hypothetical protein
MSFPITFREMQAILEPVLGDASETSMIAYKVSATVLFLKNRRTNFSVRHISYVHGATIFW